MAAVGEAVEQGGGHFCVAKDDGPFFIASFPDETSATLRAVTEGFLDHFITCDIAKNPAAETIIAAHLRLMAHLGRDPLDLPFYRQRAEIQDWALRVRAEILQTLGPAHCSTIHGAAERYPQLTPTEREALKSLMEAQTPQERGRTRPEFWAAKFDANVARDAAVQAALRETGWRVGTVWECALRNEISIAQTRDMVVAWLHCGDAVLEVVEVDVRIGPRPDPDHAS
ncbi:MAG: hypothetical protein U1D35_13600 [Paracoccaceae bacterium]|nr:hypothetical protein [Paracoccaceae bacterium]